MSKLFTPVSYNEGDLVSYEYSSATSIKTGSWVKIKSFSNEKTYVQPALVAGGGTLSFAGSAGSLQYRQNPHLLGWFPVYKDSQDPEATSLTDATISNGDKIIGFFGKEFELDFSYTSISAIGSASQGKGLVVATNSKFTIYGDGLDDGNTATVAIVVATINNILRCQMVH